MFQLKGQSAEAEIQEGSHGVAEGLEVGIIKHIGKSKWEEILWWGLNWVENEKGWGKQEVGRRVNQF